MASIIPRFLFLSLLFLSIFLVVKCDDEDDILLRGINEYRRSLNLNLTDLTKNERADCVADEVADTFNNQPCNNSLGPRNFSDYPTLQNECHLNTTTTTSDGQILLACVPNLQRGNVVSNFTSQYGQHLNSTQFSGIGIGSEDNWIVVVLTTNTPNGSFSPGSGTSNSPGGGNNSGNGASSLIAISPLAFFLIGFFVLF